MDTVDKHLLLISIYATLFLMFFSRADISLHPQSLSNEYITIKRNYCLWLSLLNGLIKATKCRVWHLNILKMTTPMMGSSPAELI